MLTNISDRTTQQLSQAISAIEIATTPVRLDQVKWINPDLANKIALIREPINGVPRNQITVPISSDGTVSDEILYEAPTDETKYYLPRYRVSERNQQIQILMAESPQGWSLTIHLEKYPAPVLQNKARSAQELTHSISVILQHRLDPNDPNAGQKELIFQEITPEPEGIKAVLQLASLPERDLVYQALTNTAYASVLIVRRSTKIGLPLSQTATSIVSSGTGTIRGTWLFNFDTGVETDKGDVWWQQETDVLRKMTPRGNAQIVSLGARDFDAIAVEELRSLAYSSNPIDGSIVIWRKRLPIDIVDRIDRVTKPDILRGVDPDRFKRVSPKAAEINQLRPIDVVGRIPVDRIPVKRPPIVISDDPAPNRSNQLTNGSVFAVRTNSGNFAKVQVIEYGYNIKIQWVTYRPPAEPQFREATRVLDIQSDYRPFVFPPSLHPYIYRNIGDSNNTNFKLDFRQSNGYSYYQDPAERNVFYYLPDSFKLVRRPESPHYPMMSIEFQPVEGSEEMQVSIEFWAYPFVNPARLAAAAKDLEQYSPSGVEFKPLVTESSPQLFLGLPKEDGSLDYRDRPNVLVEMRSGFRDSCTLSMKAFQKIYNALFTATQLFQGQVKVSLPNSKTEIIPFTAQVDDMVGEIFDVTQSIDITTGTIQVALKNAIESPVRINSLSARINSNLQVQTTITGAAFPIDLAPGASINLTVNSSIPLNNSSQAVFDFSGVDVLADREAIWNSIVRLDSTATYKRKLEVRTVSGIFSDRIAAISIDLKSGTAITFLRDATPDRLIVQTDLITPVRDWILNKVDTGSYDYRSQVILSNGTSVEDPAGQWRSESREPLWITTDKLPPLP
ncbi:hypothetical protein [Leptolyngbya sp. NIES-2104]|uniref:hypothetical protein n=1 Tax=Leptolyngbya sp. NIES-2104 TaxID=1552121 RepID=UPI00073E1713|nr:hypothetical protein [Leptolyngbya sp. NIES-2104]